MPIYINAKVGTIPYGRLRVKGKRNPPVVGERISVKCAGRFNHELAEKWFEVVVDEILLFNGDPILFKVSKK